MTATPDQLNTIYIISKGRPQCKTARTLTDMEYPGAWFIVCGTNDTSLAEYQALWGNRVLTFDWSEEVKLSDLLDNFGVATMGSGAVPVRNATRRISHERGELRHWQFDDDYNAFYCITKRNDTHKHLRLDGPAFQQRLALISTFAHGAGLANCGFAVGSDARPDRVFKFGRRVFNAHSLPSDEQLFTRWRGRMNDDLINAIETWRRGKVELSFNFMQLSMRDSQSEKGGNTEIYQDHGTVRKCAYAVIIAPQAVKLVIKFGRYHHKVNWRAVCPKIISEKYR